nr:MAG TPA: hypothetical protein [Caudoviricetes sp.]
MNKKEWVEFALYRIFYRKGKVTPQIQLNAN